jgi:glycosyltransferase involved in cell wall biosynthesis
MIMARPLRVLHLIPALHSGGVERWVVDLCTLAPAHGMAMELAVTTEINGLCAVRAKEQGILVHVCPGHERPLAFMAAFRQLLVRHGPYDAVHIHLHAFSGFAAVAARWAGVRRVVVHSHNVMANESAGWKRRTYGRLARQLISRCATAGLAPALAPLEDLLGPGCTADPRWRVLPYGVDLGPFRRPVPPGMGRRTFGIPDDAFVMLTLSRLNPEKNPLFAVRVFAALLQLRPDAQLLMLGEGPLREAIEAEADRGGFRDRVVLAGARPDVPDVLRSCADVLVFPSPPPPAGREANPLAVLEAQCCGVPVLISDGVPDEAILVPRLVARMRADADADAWARAALDHAAAKLPGGAAEALAIVEHTAFNAEQTLPALAAVYRGG